MKQEFHEYYGPTDDEFKSLWNDSLIVVDANVLLNLYSYSPKTYKELLSLLRKFGDRLWIPHQVALEYHRGRIGCIRKKFPSYEDLRKNIASVQETLTARKQHPHIDDDSVQRFSDAVREIQAALAASEKEHRDLIQIDTICDTVTEIYDGRVGKPMSQKELSEAHRSGAERYKDKIPPGYCDEKKPGLNRYGDLVLWLQLMNHAKTEGRSVIFVTDDSKEDWWVMSHDKNHGPRPELRREFRDTTSKDIYIYSSERFVQTAPKHGFKFSDPAVAEIEDAAAERLERDDDATGIELEKGRFLVSGRSLRSEAVAPLDRKTAKRLVAEAESVLEQLGLRSEAVARLERESQDDD